MEELICMAMEFLVHFLVKVPPFLQEQEPKQPLKQPLEPQLKLQLEGQKLLEGQQLLKEELELQKI